MYQDALNQLLQPDNNSILFCCKSIPGGYGHAESVYDHLLLTYKASKKLTDKPLLQLACLLHDIGKASTFTQDEKGIHFWKHDVAGAVIVFRWMRQLGFKKEETLYVTKLIKFHQWYFDKNAKEKTILRWYKKVEDIFDDLILLRCADRQGNKSRLHKPMITKEMKHIISLVGKANGLFNQTSW